MANTLLMPKATAVWLVDNTSLTFDQIAKFCDLHVLEVKGIADGDVAQGIKGMDPISSGQLSREEIQKAQDNSDYYLKLSEPKVKIPEMKRKKAPRYTPVSRRQDRPNAILWLLRHHPELKESQIMRLVGTTKPTIQAIADRSHWNSPNLQPMDPVTMGLCSQVDLDKEVQRAARRVEREQKAAGIEPAPAATLLPTAETIGQNDTLLHAEDVQDATHQEELTAENLFTPNPDAEAAEQSNEEEEETHSVESVFSDLAELKNTDSSDNGESADGASVEDVFKED